MAKRKRGRNELAREAHFRKAGPTEKTGRELRKEQRQQDRLDEKQALQEPVEEEEA